MPVERMLKEETPSRVLVARVLAEAGIEYVFGISGGHTGRIISRPRPGAEPGPHGHGARGIAGRGDGRGLRAADAAAGGDDRAGTVGARQRAHRHAGGVSVVVADGAADRFLRRAAFPLARALSAGDRRLRQLGRAPRLRRRHQAGDAGARALGRRCRRRSSRSSTRSPARWDRWRSSSATIRWPAR